MSCPYPRSRSRSPSQYSTSEYPNQFNNTMSHTETCRSAAHVRSPERYKIVYILIIIRHLTVTKNENNKQQMSFFLSCNARTTKCIYYIGRYSNNNMKSWRKWTKDKPEWWTPNAIKSNEIFAKDKQTIGMKGTQTMFRILFRSNDMRRWLLDLL